MPTFKLIILFYTMWDNLLFKNVMARPEGMEDLQGAAVLAFAQIKDTVDNGAAARDNKEFEVLGAKFKNEMAVGFGDAMKTKRSATDSSSSESDESDRRKKRAISSEENSESYEDYSASSWSSSEESDESVRRRRSASFEMQEIGDSLLTPFQWD